MEVFEVTFGIQLAEQTTHRSFSGGLYIHLYHSIAVFHGSTADAGVTHQTTHLDLFGLDGHINGTHHIAVADDTGVHAADTTNGRHVGAFGRRDDQVKILEVHRNKALLDGAQVAAADTAQVNVLGLGTIYADDTIHIQVLHHTIPAHNAKKAAAPQGPAAAGSARGGLADL